jgi:hypothetical protein
MMKIILAILLATLFVGCASVKMENKELSEKTKQFSKPSSGNSGLYIYRDSIIGAALKKDIWVDGKCIGESVAKVFFYTEVASGKSHVITTESEFSPNELSIAVEEGKNYFIRQFIKFGVFVGGAGLEIIPEEKGKAAIEKLELAKTGKCSE